MGRTTLLGDAPENPVAVLNDGRTDGYYLDNTCWGSYMHGILDNPEVLDNLAEGFDKETTDHPSTMQHSKKNNTTSWRI